VASIAMHTCERLCSTEVGAPANRRPYREASGITLGVSQGRTVQGRSLVALSVGPSHDLAVSRRAPEKLAYLRLPQSNVDRLIAALGRPAPGSG